MSLSKLGRGLYSAILSKLPRKQASPGHDTSRGQAPARTSLGASPLDHQGLQETAPKQRGGLQYSKGFGLHCELPLRSGRTVHLETLDQRLTYRDLLAGRPDREDNDERIAWAVRRAAEGALYNAPVHLIPSPRRDYFQKPGDTPRTHRFAPIPEWLPMVQCAGAFIDPMPVPTIERADVSVLVIVWYQDEFALPIAEPALGQIQAIDWEALARNFIL